VLLGHLLPVRLGLSETVTSVRRQGAHAFTASLQNKGVFYTGTEVSCSRLTARRQIRVLFLCRFCFSDGVELPDSRRCLDSRVVPRCTMTTRTIARREGHGWNELGISDSIA